MLDHNLIIGFNDIVWVIDISILLLVIQCLGWLIPVLNIYSKKAALVELKCIIIYILLLDIFNTFLL